MIYLFFYQEFLLLKLLSIFSKDVLKRSQIGKNIHSERFLLSEM